MLSRAPTHRTTTTHTTCIPTNTFIPAVPTATSFLSTQAPAYAATASTVGQRDR